MTNKYWFCADHKHIESYFSTTHKQWLRREKTQQGNQLPNPARIKILKERPKDENHVEKSQPKLINCTKISTDRSWATVSHTHTFTHTYNYTMQCYDFYKEQG